MTPHKIALKLLFTFDREQTNFLSPGRRFALTKFISILPRSVAPIRPMFAFYRSQVVSCRWPANAFPIEFCESVKEAGYGLPIQY